MKGPFTMTVGLGGTRSKRVAVTLPLPAGLSNPCTRTVSPALTLLRLNIAMELESSSSKRVLEVTTVTCRPRTLSVPAEALTFAAGPCSSISPLCSNDTTEATRTFELLSMPSTSTLTLRARSAAVPLRYSVELVVVTGLSATSKSVAEAKRVIRPSRSMSRSSPASS